jgi:uncharacterized protein YdaU (DUF1376 family)
MNYYNRHIGDYTRDTAHLSMIEDGAYTRLLDLYYTREGPIPDAEVERLCRCHGAKERRVLRRILNEFFQKMISDENFWEQKRCENELIAYREKCKTNKENGKKGGRPKTQTVISGLSNGNPDVTLPVASSHTPIYTGGSNPPLNGGKFTRADVDSVLAAYPYKNSLEGGRYGVEVALRSLRDEGNPDAVGFLIGRISEWARSHEGQGTTKKLFHWISDKKYLDDPATWAAKKQPVQKEDRPEFTDAPMGEEFWDEFAKKKPLIEYGYEKPKQTEAANGPEHAEK